MYGMGRGPRGSWFGQVWHRRGRGFGGEGPGGGPRQHGMRRPLRFLIDQLELDDGQASIVARALDDLRLEREQAGLDRRRASGRIADLVAGEALDEAALQAAADVRIVAATRARDAVVAAVKTVHAALRPDQRVKLALLLRSGPLAL